jgi:predicted ATPase
MFVERAKAADARFKLDEKNAGIIADICRQLDGLPLALELAAA